MIVPSPDLQSLALLENVRCLECGKVYAKPAAGGTVHKNPGCPVCGYLGWIPVTLPAERRPPRHSAAGRPQPRRGSTR